MSEHLLREAPQLRALKERLDFDTWVDQHKLDAWIHANRIWLNDEWIIDSTASDINHPDHRHEVSASLCIEYKRRMALLAPKSRPAAVSPGLSPTQHRPTRQPAGVLARLFGRQH